ncbi:MAG: 4a-hydroxytetrahydrobiopterin dehydratase [Nanoarchaeota archaeon]|nr:4a-hydroxytetrahydrobiopterin dehydratase [Nanoarchaeota archaeon]
MQLKDQKCACTTKQVKRLPQEGVDALLRNVQSWEVVGNHHLKKEYKFPDYMSGVQFVTQLAAIAEEQNHHPEIYLGWRRVTVEIYTHVVNGLTDNDFILAAKYDALNGDSSAL